MELTYQSVIAQILSKIDAGNFEASWTETAEEYFYKNIIAMIKEGDYTEDELFGLLSSIVINPVSRTAFQVFDAITVDETSITILSVVRLEDGETTKAFQYRRIDYDEYIKRVNYPQLNVDVRWQYYALKGNSIFITGKVDLVAHDPEEEPPIVGNNQVILTYISDLPAWESDDNLNETLGRSFIYRAIDRTAAELLDILNRSA